MIWDMGYGIWVKSKLLILIFLLIILNSNSTPLHVEASLRAGAAKAKITPQVETARPVWLAGYNGGRSAVGVHDDLWASALALSIDQTTILFISVDLIGYLSDEVAMIKNAIRKKWQIPEGQILIASTHNHSGPDTIGLWGLNGKSGKDPAYLQWLREQIILCADEALRNQKPAQIFFGKVRYSNPIEDSRPPKAANDLLLSMRVADEQDRTIAVLVNYAMHAEVLNQKNRLITADYPGILRNELEKRFGGVALFFAADIGGMQSPFVLFHSFWSCKRVGKSIAKQVIGSLKDQKPVEIKSVVVKSNQVLLPIDNPKFIGAIQKGVFGDSKKFMHKKEDKIFMPSDISFIQLGPAQFISVPGEAFPELGDILRKQMKAEYPFLLGLCNNEIGYVVPTEQWQNDGYEESMSLGLQTAPLLLDSLSELIKRTR